MQIDNFRVQKNSLIKFYHSNEIIHIFLLEAFPSYVDIKSNDSIEFNITFSHQLSH